MASPLNYGTLNLAHLYTSHLLLVLPYFRLTSPTTYREALTTPWDVGILTLQSYCISI